MRILGITLSYKDEEETIVNYKASKYNQDPHYGLKAVAYCNNPKICQPKSAPTIKITPTISYDQTTVKYTYFEYGDMLSSLGGIKAALGPVLDVLTPIFIVLFFLRLSGIIKEAYTLNYCAQL